MVRIRRNCSIARKKRHTYKKASVVTNLVQHNIIIIISTVSRFNRFKTFKIAHRYTLYTFELGIDELDYGNLLTLSCLNIWRRLTNERTYVRNYSSV